MAPIIAKKAVSAVPVAAPQRQAFVAQPAAPVPAAPVADPAAQVDPDDAPDDKPARRTRKEFATHEEFCDYKIEHAKSQLVKWNERVAIWEAKKLNKDADKAEKMQKKSDRLLESFLEIQRNMGTPEDVIQKMLAAFRENLAKSA